MVWFKVSDEFDVHHKVLAAGDSAIGLWVRCGAYASRLLTDGFVPMAVALMYAGGEASKIDHLVSAGLWEMVDGGFQMHDFTEYNPTRDDAYAERRRKAENQKAYAERKRLERENRMITGEADRSDDRPQADHVPTRPDPTRPSSKEEVVAARNRATRIPDEFIVTAEMREWARTEVPGLDLARSTRMFVDYWRAVSGRTATKIDWVATWRNWLRKDFEEHGAAVPVATRDRYEGVRRLDA